MRLNRKNSHHFSLRIWKKRISMLMTAVLLCVQAGYGLVSFVAQAAEISSSMNILTTATMAVYNDDNYTQPVTGTVYKQQSKVIIDYNWVLPDNHGYEAGDTFTFDLPEAFMLYNDVSGKLIIPGFDGDVGSFVAHKSNHKVVMTFNDYIEHNYGVAGILSFKTEFKEYSVTENAVQEIRIPINGAMQTVNLAFQPKGGALISKKGEPDGYNAKSIKWTVDVNTSLSTIAGAKVTDVIPEGLGAPKDVKVQKLNVTMDGKAHSTGDTVTEGVYYNYSYDATGKVASITFQNPINTAYRITFNTDIDNYDKVKFENTATLTGTGTDLPQNAKATVTPARGKPVDKLNTYNKGTQTLDWTVKVNYDERNPVTAIEDWFSVNQDLITTDIKVYPVTLDGSGNPTREAALTSGYTVAPLPSAPDHPGQTGISITFTSPVNKAYDIVYKTKPKNRVDGTETVTNTVYFNGEATVSKKLEQGALIKTKTNPNYANKTVGWKITINSDLNPGGGYYTMTDAVVTDTFSQGLVLDEASLVVKHKGAPLTNGPDFTVAAKDGDYSKGFIVTFKIVLDGPAEIAYTTKFNMEAPSAGGKNFPNAAHVSWLEYSVPHEQQVTLPFDPNNETKNNGFKDGSYNAVTKELTWEVGFNYNLQTLNNAVVVDKIVAPQKLVPDSVKVYAMTIAPGGNTTKGTEITNGFHVTPPQATNGNTLTVAFDDSIDKGYYLVYKTSLVDVLVDTNATNTAVLYDGAVPKSENLNASVNIPYFNEYISKTGTQSGDRIDWTININRNQSTIQNAVITDTGTANQMFVQNSFKLYNTVVSNNSVTKDSTMLVKGTDYTIDFSLDAGGKPVFELKFLTTISKPYILEYQSLVVANHNDTVSNTAGLSGTNVTSTNTSKTSDVVVKFSSGTGTGSGGITNASLTIVKKDAADTSHVLADAVFELYRKSSSGEIYVATGTTDADGKITFTHLYGGDYVLKEITAPEGYRLDTTSRNINISSATTTTVLTNQKLPSPSPSVSPSVSPSTSASVSPGASTSPGGGGSGGTSSTTPSNKPSDIPSSTPSGTPSPTPDDSEENYSTPTPSPSVSPAASVTPQGTATPGPSVAPSPTPSSLPSPEPSVSSEPQPTQSPSPGPTPLTEVTDQDTPKGGTVKVPDGGSAEISKPPEHGTLTLDDTGKWNYIPDQGYTGKDSFTITVKDKDGNEEEILIDIDVEEVPLGGLSGDPASIPDVATLPKTGEERRLLWQLTGFGLLVAGVTLRRKFKLKH